MTNTRLIPTARLAHLDAVLAKLNRRAAKKGVGSFSYNVLGTELVKAVDYAGNYVYDNLGQHLLVEYTKVEPVGVPLKIADWHLVATLDHTIEAGVLVLAVPGETVPVEFRSAEPVCQHCNVRRPRNSTIVLRHADGRYIQVGRSCVRDFIGIDPAGVLAGLSLTSTFVSAFDDEDGFGGGAPSYSIRSFLAHVAYHIRATGWVSRAHARDRDGVTATATLAYLSLTAKPGKAGYVEPTEADVARAEAALDWARSLDATDESLSDYLHSVAVACAGEILHDRTDGIVASIIPAHDRVLGREVERRRFVDLKATSRHVGTVGERIEVEATVLDVRSGQGAYGPWLLVRYVVDGSVLTWFASGEPAEALTEIGSTVRIKATIKAHQEREGLAQTALSRVALAKAKAAKKAA